MTMVEASIYSKVNSLPVGVPLPFPKTSKTIHIYIYTSVHKSSHCLLSYDSCIFVCICYRMPQL